MSSLTCQPTLSKGQKEAKMNVNNGNGDFEVRSEKDNQGLKPGELIRVKEYKRINKY